MLMFEELLPHTEQNILMHKLYEALCMCMFDCARECVCECMIMLKGCAKTFANSKTRLNIMASTDGKRPSPLHSYTRLCECC